MSPYKRCLLFGLFGTLAFMPFASAQTVNVKKETVRVKGENSEGQATELEGAEQEVTTALVRYLKSLGKVKQSDGMLILTEATVNGNTYKNAVYAIVRPKGVATQAWLGIKKDEWSDEEAVKINGELEKVLYDFGVKYYRDKIQGQIDESMRALSAVEKQQQRFTNEGRNLLTRLEDNRREKVQLEKSLENNKVEHETLLQRIEKNKKDQDSIAVATEQVKKVVEMHRERQRKVN